jgi:hypothetical protein
MARFWSVATVLWVALASAGCTLLANAPLPLSLLRAPLTIDTGDRNDPLTDAERCRLQLMAEDAANGVSRTAVKDKYRYRRHDRTFFPYCASAGHDAIESDFDTLQDLIDAPTIIFVAISGGGSRAASLAAHTMSLLERRVNELARELDRPRSAAMVDAIDAFSTVSGGSIYAYRVARTKAVFDRTLRDGPPDLHQSLQALHASRRQKRAACSTEDDFFADFSRCFFTYQGTVIQNVGLASAAFYFSPTALFLAPALIATTDLNYLDILAGGLSYIGLFSDLRFEASRSVLALYKELWPTTFRLGDLSDHPRMFFNATVLETGYPFIFTKRLMHLPLDSVERRTVRLDVEVDRRLAIQKEGSIVATAAPPVNHALEIRQPKPLAQAITLEELNSSPARFPLAYAVMASAAFPIGIEPLRIVKFGYDPGTRRLHKSAERLLLTDGGVFDNSGLTTVIDLAAYIKERRRLERQDSPQRMIILSINAEGDDYDVYYPKRTPPEPPWYERWFPFRYFTLKLIPLRVKALGFDALDVIHFTNKRRAEEIALRRLKDLLSTYGREEIHYLPVGLSQLSIHDSNRIVDPHNLFDRIRQIPTRYAISSADSLLLAQAAQTIVTARQGIGWKLGPTCNSQAPQPVPSVITRLDEAFAYAVLRREDWPQVDNDDPGARSKWCP